MHALHVTGPQQLTIRTQVIGCFIGEKYVFMTLPIAKHRGVRMTLSMWGRAKVFQCLMFHKMISRLFLIAITDVAIVTSAKFDSNPRFYNFTALQYWSMILRWFFLLF